MRHSFDRAGSLARSRLYKNIRQYFSEAGVLEVEVPLLGKGASLDAHLESLSVDPNGEALYLQTSPEFFMKRLLCYGSGDIYSITKAFRGGEVGRLHNPEFSLLEWYRQGFSLDTLIDELIQLFRYLGIEVPVHRFCYADVFMEATGQNPHRPDRDRLQAIARQEGFVGELDTSELLDFVVSSLVEPKLPSGLTVIDEFPACQSELAEVSANSAGELVAQRFELYWGGVELANGYKELIDPAEQRRRFQAAELDREKRGLPKVRVDEQFLAAMELGMPNCSGVALGLDRLLACMSGQKELSQGMCFPWSRL